MHSVPDARLTHPVIWSLTAHTIAWPGGMRISRGVRPFHMARSPSSRGMVVSACRKLVYRLLPSGCFCCAMSRVCTCSRCAA